MNSTSATTPERVTGVLLGLAAGDFHGGPIRMAVRLAESLYQRRGFVPQDVLDRYLDWYSEGAFDTGPVAEKVFARIARGEEPTAAVRHVHKEQGELTAGCNAAHRSSPLAMARFLDESDLVAAACRDAALTHFDPLAGDVAAAVVTLCRGLILGDDWPGVLTKAATGRAEATQKSLQVVDRESLDQSGFAPAVLAAAVHFVDRNKNLEAALEEASAFAGRWNYCTVLVGAIGGAHWGVGAISPKLVRHTGLLPRIRIAAAQLAADWGGPVFGLSQSGA